MSVASSGGPAVGRLLVVRGDIAGIRCDAWLVPTDSTVAMNTQAWRASARPGFAWPARSSMVPWDGTQHRTWVVRDYYGDSAPHPAPLPILTDVGGTVATPLAWYLDGLRQFVGAAVEAIATDTRSWRGKPLLAVPLVGTGRGGKAMVAGDVAEALVGELESLAARYDVDIVLVARTAAAYSAIQTCRTPSLDGELGVHRAQAERLGDAVRADRLGLFLGAGISKPAGLPGWSQLLDELAREFGVDSLTDARVTERRLRLPARRPRSSCTAFHGQGDVSRSRTTTRGQICHPGTYYGRSEPTLGVTRR